MDDHATKGTGRRGDPVLRIACALLLLLAPLACDDATDGVTGDPGNVGQTIGPGASSATGGGGGSQAGEGSLDELLAALASGDTWDRVAAIGGLADLGDAAAVPAVSAALADESWDVRLAAATALADLGDERAVDGLVALLGEALDLSGVDPADQPTAEETAGAVVDALGAIGDPGPAGSLAAILAKETPAVDADRVSAALVAIGPDGIPGIRRAIRDASPSGAARIVAVLGGFGRPALDALADLVRDKRTAIRVAAAGALGGLDSDAVPVLLKALKDGSDDVRVAAARSLGSIGSPKATEGLVRLLSDSDTRRAAVGALVKIHRGNATPLVKYLGDKDTVQVYRPLIKIGQDNTVGALAKALKRYGTKTMGETYLNCGQPRLEKAAKEWAADHGYIVVPSGFAGEEAWGVP